MRFRTYIRVEGSTADLACYELAVRGAVAGELLHRKHNGAPLAQVPLAYWKSEEVSVIDGHPEDVLLGLLQEIQSTLKTAAGDRDMKITAVIVSEYSENEVPRGGYFLSRELVSALHALNAQLDIDSAPLVD